MKTNIFNITALALLITTGLIASKNTTLKNAIGFNSEKTTSNTIAFESTNVINYVKAIKVGNEIMPVVDLPEFSVIGAYNKANTVKAKFVNGELIAVVDLPELTIEG